MRLAPHTDHPYKDHDVAIIFTRCHARLTGKGGLM